MIRRTKHAHIRLDSAVRLVRDEQFCKTGFAYPSPTTRFVHPSRRNHNAKLFVVAAVVRPYSVGIHCFCGETRRPDLYPFSVEHRQHLTTCTSMLRQTRDEEIVRSRSETSLKWRTHREINRSRHSYERIMHAACVCPLGTAINAAPSFRQTRKRVFGTTWHYSPDLAPCDFRANPPTRGISPRDRIRLRFRGPTKRREVPRTASGSFISVPGSGIGACYTRDFTARKDNVHFLLNKLCDFLRILVSFVFGHPMDKRLPT